MKKYLLTIAILCIVVSLVCGCASNQNHTSMLEAIDLCYAVVPTDPTQVDENTDRADTVAAIETAIIESASNVNNLTDTIKFSINEKEYNLGMPFGEMLNDFEAVEKMDGTVLEDGNVPIFEKVTFTLSDNSGHEFIVVVRNDSDKQNKIEECIVHEILFKDIQDNNIPVVEILGVTVGNTDISEYIEKFGDDYKEYEGSPNDTYSWNVVPKCWIDVCVEVETGNITSIQLMTY